MRPFPTLTRNLLAPRLPHPGTSLRYRPGLVLGGANLQHDCGTSRSIGYYLEPLLLLGLFGKKVCALIGAGGSIFAVYLLSHHEGEAGGAALLAAARSGA